MDKVIVVGSGPAGLTAALYLARANLSPIVIAGDQPGGQLMTTTDVDNFPGFPQGIQGPQLMAQMFEQVERFGAKIVRESATKITLGSDGKTEHSVEVGEKTYTSKALVIATGATALWLNLPSEQRLKGKGVSACATCDGFFFKGKNVAVVGGGDTALEEATFMTHFAKKVYVIHRRDSLRASKIMQDRAFANAKIEFVWNARVSEVIGEDKVSGVELEDTVTGDKTSIAVEGLFIAIGHKPNSDVIMDSRLTKDEIGYLNVEHEVFTNVEGVFVAGDVSDKEYRQAITAAGSGCKAALAAERYLSSLNV